MKKNKFNTALLITIASVLYGCATLESISAGHIGCPPEKITISEHKSNYWDRDTWVATCEGKRYICHSQNQGQSDCTLEQ